MNALLQFLLQAVMGGETTAAESLIGSAVLILGLGLPSGDPAIKHVVLRFLLHRQGHIPHNYAQFLKYTTERRLTQQIGGRFRFIHRELLDHFAAIDTDASRAP